MKRYITSLLFMKKLNLYFQKQKLYRPFCDNNDCGVWRVTYLQRNISSFSHFLLTLKLYQYFLKLIYVSFEDIIAVFPNSCWFRPQDEKGLSRYLVVTLQFKMKVWYVLRLCTVAKRQHKMCISFRQYDADYQYLHYLH